MQKIPDRFIWAVKLMDIKPSEQILEIGCGAGTLASLIAEKLSDGRITAMDQSNSMIQKARKNLEQHIRAGRAEILVSDFAGFNSKMPFDKIVAFNVNFFWKNFEGEFQSLEKIIRRKSVLFIFYDAPGKVKTVVVDAIRKNLLKHSFAVADALYMDENKSVCCIQAVPAFK
jgi:tRNA A58 N-methylase Trm61